MTWEEARVWLDVWRVFLDTLRAQGRLRWEECFADGSFASAKRGDGVGKTKLGKGTKSMVVVDGEGVPLACHLGSASTAEVKLLEPTLDNLSVEPLGETTTPQPQRLVCDKAYDSDALRQRLHNERGIEVICPHRKNRRRAALQDGRPLRRYRRRWKVERTFAWLGNFRRLVVRYEHKLLVYQAFFHLACLLITLRKL